jgi:hypothetical protein
MRFGVGMKTGHTLEEVGQQRVQRVGWVERSDTHQLHLIEMMGFAGSTHPTTLAWYSYDPDQCSQEIQPVGRISVA